MIRLEQTLPGASQLIMRMFTDAPTQRCGFHIDTALPRSSTIGLVRVFNGTRTLYVHPENIISMNDFYQYLGKREQLGKELA